MKFSDFLYFTKGDRQGLILLVCLIIVSAIILIISKAKPEASVSKHADTLNVSVSTPSPSSPSSSSSEIKESAPSSQPAKSSPASPSAKESVKERVARITSSNSKPKFQKAEKYEQGTVIELNGADTVALKKIPGIGSSFAKRIIGYRKLLGGYYDVQQLREVYGIDDEKFNSIASWFTVDAAAVNKIDVNTVSFDTLNRHPYVDYNQTKTILQLRRQKGRLSGWENLELLDEFSEEDKKRLKYYLKFE